MEPLNKQKKLYRADGGAVTTNLFPKIGLDVELKSYFEKLYNKPGQYPEAEDVLNNVIKPPSGRSWDEYFTEKLKGMEFTDPAFMSTSRSERGTYDSLNTHTELSPYGITGLLEINVPKGIRAVDMQERLGVGEGRYKKEKEVLLDKNTSYKINSVKLSYHDNGILARINVDAIQKDPMIKTNSRIAVIYIKEHENVLLEDVTNFIKLNYNCPNSEKQGTGPGSCGGSVDKESKPSSNDIWLSKIGKLPEDEPGYFYHTTTKDVLDSIKSRGLVGNQKEHNFSSNVNPNTHLTFLSASIEDKEETENNPRSVGVSYWSKMLFEKNKKDPVILRVKKENVSGVKEFGKGYEFRTKDKIDPKNLQYWSGNKWHDLSDLKKQDSAYLADAFETIKLNYKCKAGTVDDSNKCNIDEKESSATSISFKETPQQEKMRSNMESTIGQINENLESMVTEFRNDTKRYNALYKRSPESLSKALFNLPVKEKWAKMEDSFLEARKQYIDSFGGRLARTPESEQTLKLKPQQREYANKLRDVSNTILESANTVQKDSLLSFVIDSASINNSLIDGINISDNKISEIIMNDIDDESVREYIRTVFNTSDEEILKNTVGNLAKQYWEPTKDRYLKAGYKNLQSNLQDIKHMDELISSSIAPSDLVVYSGISENVIPNNLNVGDEITLKCYLSTSRLKEVASGFAKLKKGYTVAINIKPGTSALAIEDYQYNNKDMVYTMYPQISWTYADKDESHGWIVGESGKKDTGGSQREVIISRNQKYRVAKVGKNNLELETINGD